MPATRYSLIARLSEPGDTAAWSEFLEHYEDAIWRFSRGCGLQDADAGDVVQEVFLLVHQKIGNWIPTGRPGGFRCWLIKTAHHVCLRAIRDSGRLDRAVGGSSAYDRLHCIRDIGTRNDSDVDWRAWAFCWAAGIVQREVGPAPWSAFVMNAVEGIPAAEVAQRVGMTTGGVYLAKCRILARVRTVVSELAEEGR